MVRILRILCLVIVMVVPASVAHGLNIITFNTTVTPLWQLAFAKPVDNALLDGSPPSVSLSFSENINKDNSSLAVYDPYDNAVGGIKMVVDGATMSAKLPHLLNGTYRVEWKTDCMCAQSTPLQGTLHFTVQ